MFVLMLLCVGLAFSLTSCGDDNNEHIHTPNSAVRENEIAATCASAGSYDEVVYCAECSEEISRTTKATENLSHTESDWITDAEATCKAEEAKHKECTECHTVLENGAIGKLTTHTPASAVIENEVDSTCFALGSYDEVVYCSVCEIELSREEKEISLKDHTSSGWITDTEATCKAEGAKHKECTVCHEVLENGVIALADHTPVVDSAVEATDTKDGLTEGSHCSFCGKVLVAQQIIPAKLQGTNVKSEQLTVDGDRIYGSVSNTTTIFSFLNDITVNDSASYIVARDIDCTQTIPSKTTSIGIGDNTFYILVSNGNAMKLYTVTVRRLPTYTVSFNTHGGAALDSLTIEEGSTVSAPVSEKAGYGLDGWAVNGELVSFPYDITSDVELEAVFSPIVYDITYELNGGVNAEGIPDTYTVETSTITLGTPTRDYYDFVGWYDNADFEGSAVTQIALGSIGDITLYARWTPTVYEIKYNLNGGINAEENPENYTIESDTVILAAPARAGYAFVGWFIDAECTESITEISHGSHGIIEIYAKWETKVYNIGYEPNGGTNSESNPDTYTVETNSITLGAPTRDYYDFAGWYDNADFEGSAITQIALGSIGDITLYARWTPTVYEIKYNLNGGINAEENPENYTIESDTVILAAPARAGYAFVGWFIDAECTESITEISHGSHEKVEIYAKWEAVYIVSGNSITGLTDYAKTNVIELHIPSAIDDSQITSIGDYAFRNCTSLTSVTIGNGVTSIGSRAFLDCTSLTSVYILDIAKWCGISFESSSANPLYYAHNLYLNGELVTELVIPDSVTNIGDSVFEGCTNLTSVVIPDSVTSIGSYAFLGCTTLTSVYILDIAKWCGISFESSSANPLYYAHNLYLNGELVTELVVPNSVTNIGESAFYNCTSLTSVVIPDGVTSIGNYAFLDCTSLTSITIPDSVTSIGYEAFRDCTSLTSVVIPDSVTSIGYEAFRDCTSLTSITIPNSVTSIGGSAFEGCKSLTSVTIPDSVTSISDSAFEDCTSLTSVTIGSGVTSISDSAFEDCTGLTSVYISDIAKWCSISFESSFANPLYYAHNLYLNGELVTELVVPNSVTSIGYYAFRNCTSLTSVTIPDSVTNIGDSAFSGCTSLTSVVIPDSVTSIRWGAFSDCTSLTSVVIPDSVTSIGYSAFYGCSSLTSVYYDGTNDEWAEISIGSNNSSLTNATHYYYSETEPTEEGNYWYYDENGEIAIWE